METHEHDRVFILTFLGVLGFLVAFTIGIWVIAAMVGDPAEDSEFARARLEERIAPAGKVITDPAALMQVTAATEEKREPRTGAEVAQAVCNACHATGVLEAPKNGDQAAWGKRKAAAGGLDGLVKSAMAGKNAMPPKGGDPTLTEAEVKAAIQEMLK